MDICTKIVNSLEYSGLRTVASTNLMPNTNIAGLAHGLALLAMVTSTYTQAFETELYGSLRLGAEAVNPDNNPGNFDSYYGLRDAYTRVGLKLQHPISDDWSLLAQLELPFDIANGQMQLPYNDRDDIRIAKIQTTGPIGTAWYGRGWMAYYNYIAYPLDFFSSYYSGWATLTTFRREQTFYYASPTWQGLQIAVASTEENDGASGNRNQYVLAYSNDKLNIAIGKDDPGDTGYDIIGASVSYTSGSWYLAAKYEQLDYDSSNVWDGSAKNLLVQYAMDNKNTVRGMIADVDAWGGYGDAVLHLGWDHQYNDQLKIFVEYYQEESTAAISNRKMSSSLGSPGFNQPADDGGQVFTVGIHYHFSTK